MNLGCPDVVAIRRELGTLPQTTAVRGGVPRVSPGRAASAGAHQAVLATWHQLIDEGSLLDGDRILHGTARPAVVALGKAIAGRLGVSDGAPVMVVTDRGCITLPASITEMPDGVVWVPSNSPGSAVARTLGVTAGELVTVQAAGGA